MRLKALWDGAATPSHADASDLERLIDPERLAAIDPFDLVQLEYVVATCRAARSLSEAGRVLFAKSREQRASTNDADRLRKYLGRFGLAWADFKAQAQGLR